MEPACEGLVLWRPVGNVLIIQRSDSNSSMASLLILISLFVCFSLARIVHGHQYILKSVARPLCVIIDPTLGGR